MVPKALAFSGSSAAPAIDDEEEKTTLESGWEEEASTTVEQGEVAEKIRSLNLEMSRKHVTGVTSTSGHGVDNEPTVDDQRANAALSMITPPSIPARLLITQGNDRGQEVEIIPGKSYTIGRALDNDVVLTDIAVSRKHFDLRHENGSWVVADRGSGNGTLINGAVEDQPFMLAHGDVIEIGNTTFRFDHPSAPPRNAFPPAEDQPTNGFGPSGLDAGRLDAGFDPNRSASNGARTYDLIEEEEPSTVAGKPIRDPALERPQQPIPPPPPLRPKTIPPPTPMARARPVSNPPPLAYPSGSAPPAPLPPALQPTVAPHQGMPAIQPSMLHGMAPPQARPGMLGPGQPTVLGDAALPGVMPTTIPGQGPPMHPSPPHVQALPFTYPNLADHAQHMRISTGLPPRDATATAHVAPTPYNAAVPLHSYSRPAVSRRTKLVLGGAGLAIVAAIATAAIIKAASDDTEDSVTATDSQSKPDVKPIDPPKETPKKDPPKVAKETPKKDPPKVAKETPKKDPPKVAKETPEKDPPKQEDPPKLAKETPEKDPPEKDPPKQDPPPEKDPPRVVRKDPRKDPPKRRDSSRRDPPKRRRDPPRREPRRVAAAVDTDATKSKAARLFRGRKFNDAAKVLRAAASRVSGRDATELKTLAGLYEQFGRAFNVGMAPQTQQDDAWNRLTSAKAFDKDGVFTSEINARLSEIATKAALRFVGSRQFFKALKAVRVAERSGSNTSTRIVRSKISDYAGELYAQAAREISNKPRDAKIKLKQIKTLVDSKNPWYVKATKLLARS